MSEQKVSMQDVLDDAKKDHEQKVELLKRFAAPMRVLDKGHIRLVDMMGSDRAIVQAARISYGKGTKSVSEDEGLIRYLYRNRHTTPFEMCEIKFHVRIPMDAWRQMIRHRTASVNEYSTRYSEAINDKQVVDEWRFQSKDNKQGSGESLDDEGVIDFLSQREAELHALADEVYKERIERGVAREQARKDLPLSTYTEAYWKIDLHNLLHYLGLRMHEHAQQEIRSFANQIGEVVKAWCPMAFDAFMDYHHNMNGMLVTAREIDVLSGLTAKQPGAVLEQMQCWGWVDEANRPKKNRELKEFMIKAEALGFRYIRRSLGWEE